MNCLPQISEPKNLEEAKLQINKLGRNMHEHAYLVGEILLWVKIKIGHGNFLPWVKQNVWFGKRTAQNFISFANRCDRKKILLDYHGQEKAKNELNSHLASSDTCAISDLESLISSGKKFRTIYADPPWKYQNQATRAATDNHYNTLSPEEIAQLPIKELAEDEAHLHFWTTNAFLFDSKAIIEAWGFEYKSCFVWVKPQMGIGNYWRVSHEFLLLGVRGGLRFMDNSQMSWMEVKRRGHSEKPDEIRQVIEKVSQPQRLELFGRKLFPGWVVWGNQIERNLFNEQFFKT